ncbi:hypothetical protein CANARDRAFT_8162 [[Candida] arabinofermentans NRRL YB-2248]|uniref:Phosphoribulokinase/uridine kinase domain-containing protein n=1 Tax=[Candida] arabinofermentans NRRL YB-2248 TaxID=983967 RepID=A0A1E4SZZ4_9ASCO|nr:hypothetical protein CANARDRAFT_8162 [[Candida] arabinofermentans NRRL YB-2248]
MSVNERVVIVGVSGASSSGKTTVSKVLHSLFPNSVLIHQDDFYLPDEDIPFDNTVQDLNWDCVEAINFEQLSKVLTNFKTIPGFVYSKATKENDDFNKSLSKQTDASIREKISEKLSSVSTNVKFVFLDGFLLYQNEQLAHLFDVKLFFKTDFQTLKQRRDNREYVIDNGVWVDPPNYFENLVWKEYYKNHNFLFVDGDNEENVKLNKNDLNSKAKSLGIKGFNNDNDCIFDDLLNDVVSYILDQI